MRGTVIGEQVHSQAATEDFRKGYDAAFGADKKPQRGKWVYDERQQKLVPADEYVPPHSEDDAAFHVVSDRYMEGVHATDGTDIGSRAKRRAYMQENGLADYDDFSPAYREGVKKDFERQQDRERHQALKRAIYEHKERARNKR